MSSSGAPTSDGALLRIDLAALAANYRDMAEKSAPAACAAVVKADAYGLGLEPVVRCLLDAGCTQFCVAQLGEGVRLRAVAPEAEIYVLNGLIVGAAAHYAEHALRPCLATPEQIADWMATAAEHPAAVQIDTGFTRLGLTAEDLADLDLDWTPCLVMSHLACADTPDHPMNRAQLERFHDARARFPDVPASLANSGGVLMGKEYLFDMTRVGIGLYGGAPTGDPDDALRPVAHLEAHIVQIHPLGLGDSIGYGARFAASEDMRIGIVAAGYGDGLPRGMGRATPPFVHIAAAGVPVPVIGRMSMDSFAVDLTYAPETLRVGDRVELWGAHAAIDTVAQQAGTIAYELLTGLASRYKREYVS